MNSSSASKVSERHSVLVNNIGTFEEEDEAHELLNSLSTSLPFVVMVIWVLDALLAAVYLKWLHPWKILLQEVSSVSFPAFIKSFKLTPCQEPEQWGLEMFKGDGVEQPDEVDFNYYFESKPCFSKWGKSRQGTMTLLLLVLAKR